MNWIKNCFSMWSDVPLVEKLAVYTILIAASSISQPQLGVSRIIVEEMGLPRSAYVGAMWIMLISGVILLLFQNKISFQNKVVFLVPFTLYVALTFLSSSMFRESAVSFVTVFALWDVTLSQIGKSQNQSGVF